MSPENHPEIRPKTRQILAKEYGIHRNTLTRWFKRYGIEVGEGMLTPLEVKNIYDTFGWPNFEQPNGSHSKNGEKND
ncbi:MAG: helix-turn-helix domain-containing protein [Bacteroidota bacterium]